MSKVVTFSPEATLRFLAGVDALARAVSLTLGPTGRNVLLDRVYGPPVSTKDGVTVAKELHFANPVENIGAQILKEIAMQVSIVAGDGTTTAVTVARAILADGVRLAAAGHDLMTLKRGIDKAAAAARARLREISIPVETKEQIARVATIAANGDREIGELVATATERVGREGLLVPEDGRGLETTVDYVEGYDFDRGYYNPDFALEGMGVRTVLEKPFILVHCPRLVSLAPLVPSLEAISRLGRSLLVIATEYDKEVLGTFATNNRRGSLPCQVVRAPFMDQRRSQTLEDIAVFTGGRMFENEADVRVGPVRREDFGEAERVTVDRSTTTIIGGGGRKEEIERRANMIRAAIEREKTEFEREKLEERLAKLVAGIATIRVGGATEIDMKERKYLVDNAISAVRAAVAEGIVPGGGVALVRAAAGLDALEVPPEERPGVEIVRRALEEPLRRIAANTGAEPAVVAERIRTSVNGTGFDARHGRFADLVEIGVVDPARVVRLALESAVSAAGLLLTAETAVASGRPAPEKDYYDPPMPDFKKMRPRMELANKLK